MILVPVLNISFITNHANDRGGARYFGDSKCLIALTAPLECFFSIWSLNHSFYPNGKNITLFFKDNSAGLTGSVLYGGHLNECRLYHGTSYKLKLEACDANLSNYYRYVALEVFSNITKILPHNKVIASILSPAKLIRLCNTDHDNRLSVLFFHRLSVFPIYVHPGQQFNITLQAKDTTGTPVPTNILIDSLDNKHRLHPLSQIIDASCTNVHYHLYSFEVDRIVQFRL